MKKFYKIFTAAVVFLLVASAAYAGGSKEIGIKEPTEKEKEAGWRYFKHIGFKLHRPAFFDTYGDNVNADSSVGEEDKKTDEVIYKVYLYEFTSDELNEKYDAIVNDKKLSREQKIERITKEVDPNLKPIYKLVVLRTPLIGKKTLAELTGLPNNEVIRETKDFTQILAIADFNADGLSEKSAKIYKEMISQVKPIIPTIHCTDPISAESGMIKSVKGLTFNTIDLEGKKVTSSILSKYDVTMINIWATWCPPCRAELPEIAKLYEAFKDKGCNIIGLTGDVSPQEQDALAKAKELTSKAGCKYTVVQYNDTFKTLRNNLAAWPTTIFVDKKGNIIASSVNDIIVGSRDLAEFTEAMEKALKAVGK
ncbi:MULTISPECIES: TlpA disulfide reductase family protein [unclassified Treponema]|uniref:TlpA disulfide reductase family protein n=1 Tax=unclassified Treponema TaxID=2638727 RepID=UPI0020A536D7|nr:MULTISPECIES: TlpA disulfide reductase family protein [unclassified Treponema]UTC67454.1 TlpA family protein disulfide reductase [Treponema sp. OMZ 789]UTC70182.1 TlpA family protein disulfide reductase [Treponema sp. OMZ 790]UTC72897.1 TlpA family protein disulfide reductase [Treponema sp. OMZ 791]